VSAGGIRAHRAAEGSGRGRLRPANPDSPGMNRLSQDPGSRREVSAAPQDQKQPSSPPPSPSPRPTQKHRATTTGRPAMKESGPPSALGCMEAAAMMRETRSKRPERGAVRDADDAM